MTWKFYVETQPWKMFRRRLHIMRESGPHRETYAVVKPLEFIALKAMDRADDGDWAVQDDASARDSVTEFLHGALDAAWDLGLRPTGYRDHTNELAATCAHLDDMRTIVGAKLEVPLLLGADARRLATRTVR